MVGWAGIYAAFLQLPAYLAWALASRGLKWKHKLLWASLLLFLNMFTIPMFLYAKYSGTLGTVLSRHH